MLSKELLSKVKNIHIHARYLVNDAFAGEYESTFKGRGISFEEVREYQPGDDIRTIDWNVTARSQTPFVKIFRDERELTVIFLVDISASSRFGSFKRFKNEVAAELTAVLAYTALKNNDKVGLIIFAGEVEHYLPPKKGRAHIWRLIRDILSYEPKSKATNFAAPLFFLNQVVKRKAVTFMISDFQDLKEPETLKSTAKHHDLIAIKISDPRELDLPSVGYIELEDAETGEAILIDTRKDTIQKYRKETHKNKEALKSLFRSWDIDFVEVNTNENPVEPLVRFFRERGKR